MAYDKLILVHNGALGDFLTVWPGLWALRRRFAALPALWAGRGERALWLDPLGVEPAPPAIRDGVEQLYSASELPAVLGGALVVWFGLSRRPFELAHPDLWFIPTLDTFSAFDAASCAPPTLVARRLLEERGVAWDEDWLAVWRARCGAWTATNADLARVLLFSGAGHRSKQWPLEHFVELAARLARRGLQPAFVLGPAELERGLDPALVAGKTSAWTVERCERLPRLVELLQRAGNVVGNDCGPMHLSGILGAPSVVLFGPTSERQWGQSGARALCLDIACRPCTATTQDLRCSRPLCLEELDVDRVESALLETMSAL